MSYKMLVIAVLVVTLVAGLATFAFTAPQTAQGGDDVAEWGWDTLEGEYPSSELPMLIADPEDSHSG